jgi:hypothetical protein
MGSMFEMSSVEQLDAARTRLAWAGIRSQRTRTRPTANAGPFLAVSHTDANLDRVCRIIGDIDHFARRL